VQQFINYRGNKETERTKFSGDMRKIPLSLQRAVTITECNKLKKKF